MHDDDDTTMMMAMVMVMSVMVMVLLLTVAAAATTATTMVRIADVAAWARKYVPAHVDQRPPLYKPTACTHA